MGCYDGTLDRSAIAFWSAPLLRRFRTALGKPAASSVLQPSPTGRSSSPSAGLYQFSRRLIVEPFAEAASKAPQQRRTPKRYRAPIKPPTHVEAQGVNVDFA
jgi:hypothetical protein